MSYIREFATMDNILFSGYLLWISIQDIKEMKVARYSHILGVMAIVWAAVSQNYGDEALFSIHSICELMLIFVLQLVGYHCKCYGLADVIVICICSLFYFFQNAGEQCLRFYFVLYAISGILLVITQLQKGNIKGGSLKKPIPYIPYISVAFFLTKWVL